MCPNGVDTGVDCRFCGKPLLICWDDGPSICWHQSDYDAERCLKARLAGTSLG